MIADVMALRRAGTLAHFTYSKSGSTVTLLSYLDLTTVGPSNPPIPTVDGTGQVTWTFPRFWLDEFGVELPIKILGGRCSKHVPTAGDAVIVSHTARSVTVASFNAAGAAVDSTVSVKLYGTACPSERQRADIGDYGGDPEMRDCSTEGDVPHAAGIFESLMGARPNSLTRDVRTYVGAETLGLARAIAAVCYRLPEQLEANGLPGEAEDWLEYWLGLLKIPAGNLPRWRLRQLAAAADRSAKVPTTSRLRDIAESIFGEFFIQIDGYRGDTPADEPYGTYWVGGTAVPPTTFAPESLDLGGGVWTSYRDRVVAVVRHPRGAEVTPFLDAVARWRDAWGSALPTYKTMHLREVQSNLLILSDANNMPAASKTAGLSDSRSPEGPVLKNREAP